MHAESSVTVFIYVFVCIESLDYIWLVDLFFLLLLYLLQILYYIVHKEIKEHRMVLDETKIIQGRVN